MGIGICSRQIRVDLIVVRSRCVAEVHFPKVLLKACSGCLLLGCGALLQCAVPHLATPILLLQGRGKPVGG